MIVPSNLGERRPRAFAVWWLCLVIVVGLSVAMHGHPEPWPGDRELAGWVQARPFRTLATFANDLAYAPVAVAIGLLVAGWLLYRRALDEALIVTLAVAVRPLNSIVKELVERPRPTRADANVIEIAGGFSFPSGHAFGSAMLFGALLVVLWRAGRPALRWKGFLSIGLLAIIVSCGLARVYVGAHWPTDVGGAWLFAAFWLGVLARIAAFIRSSFGPLDRFS